MSDKKNKFSEQLESTQDMDEMALISKVAQEYSLDETQSKMLWAIRKTENGRVGREFGVLNPEAMRFENDPFKSFVTQARWAAGSIKKRYKGDMNAFRDRWAPIDAENDPTGLNKNWVPNMEHFMKKAPNFGGK